MNSLSPHKYILVRGDETVEVLEGREEKRDRLIAAGYEWVNRPSAEQEKSKEGSPKSGGTNG